jgi:hypothetical protein
MDRREIAPYNRSWSEVVSGHPAQTVVQGARRVSRLNEGARRTRNERRMQDRDPLAYSRSKTVQTMGGSSKIAVFMNKAKPYGGRMTKETQFYWDSVKRTCRSAAKEHGIRVKFMESVIFERVGIKRAITQGMPSEFVPDFRNLWEEMTGFLDE